MKIILLTSFAMAFLVGCKRGQRTLEIMDVKPVGNPVSVAPEPEQNAYEWDGLSDVALSGLRINNK